VPEQSNYNLVRPLLMVWPFLANRPTAAGCGDDRQAHLCWPSDCSIRLRTR